MAGVFYSDGPQSRTPMTSLHQYISWSDRGAWRSRIKMIFAVNKEVDSRKREERKIKCIKTRSAIVVI
jgi:hypothetical protein